MKTKGAVIYLMKGLLGAIFFPNQGNFKIIKIKVQTMDIRRGRVDYQKSSELLIEKSREIVQEKMKEWIDAQ